MFHNFIGEAINFVPIFGNLVFVIVEEFVYISCNHVPINSSSFGIIMFLGNCFTRFPVLPVEPTHNMNEPVFNRLLGEGGGTGNKSFSQEHAVGSMIY